MKLGIITDEVTQDIKKAIGFAVKHRLDGIELRSVSDMDIDRIPPEKIKEIKKAAEDKNLDICCLSSTFFKCSIDSKQEYEDNIEKLKRLIDISHVLGCNKIRGFSFFRSGSFDKRLDEIAEKFIIPIDLLENENIQILLESDPSVFTTNCAMLSRLIAVLNCEYIRAVYDPGNDIFDPNHEKPFPDGFSVLKNYIKHVHIKDAIIKNGKAEAVKVGTGIVPFDDILKALHHSKYDGYLVLETHYRPKGTIPDELLKKPRGSRFSFNGDIASRECMIELKRISAPYLNKK